MFARGAVSLSTGTFSGRGHLCAMIVKLYRDPARVSGRPEPGTIKTCYVERHNLTMRMSMRRFIRQTMNRSIGPEVFCMEADDTVVLPAVSAQLATIPPDGELVALYLRTAPTYFQGTGVTVWTDGQPGDCAW